MSTNSSNEEGHKLLSEIKLNDKEINRLMEKHSLKEVKEAKKLALKNEGLIHKLRVLIKEVGQQVKTERQKLIRKLIKKKEVKK